MITLFISDLHLGDSQAKPEEVIRFLEMQPEVGRLVIVGDLFDLWVDRFDKILEVSKEFLRYIKKRFGTNLIFLAGNHDSDLKPLEEVYPRMRDFLAFRANKQKLLVTHGHQYDENIYLEYFPYTARIGSWLVSKAYTVFGLDLRRFLMTLPSFKNAAWYSGAIDEYNQSLTEKILGYDIIIVGHFHQPGIFRLVDKVIMNAGDWLQNSSGVKMTEEGFYLISLEGNEIKVLDSYLYEKEEEVLK